MKNSKNFLFYFPELYPCITGGMEIYNYYLVNNITKFSGVNWFLLTDCKKYKNKKITTLLSHSRLFIIRRYGLSSISNIIYMFFSTKIKLKKIDLVLLPYTDNFNWNVIGFLILKFLFNVNYIIHIHDGGQKPWKPYWLQKMFFKNAKKIAGVSNEIVQEYNKRTKVNIDLIHPLIPLLISNKSSDLIKSNFNINHFDKIVLFVGSLKNLKDPFYIVKTIQSLNKNFLQLHKIGFLFAGNGPLMEELKIYIKKHFLEEFIKLLGKIPNNLIKDLYKISDVFIISSDYEGTPLVLMEAMFNKLICIGSNVNGINNLIRPNTTGLLFDKHKDDDLKNILEDVLVNTNKYRHLGENAGTYIHENYNYGNYIEDLYNWAIK